MKMVWVKFFCLALLHFTWIWSTNGMKDGILVPATRKQNWTSVLLKNDIMVCMAVGIFAVIPRYLVTLADCFVENGNFANAIDFRIVHSTRTMNYQEIIEQNSTHEIDYVVFPKEYEPGFKDLVNVGENIAVIALKTPMDTHSNYLAVMAFNNLAHKTKVTTFSWGKTDNPTDHEEDLHYVTSHLITDLCIEQQFLAVNRAAREGKVICFNTTAKTDVSMALKDRSGAIFSGFQGEYDIYDDYLVGIFYDHTNIRILDNITKYNFEKARVGINIAYWAPWIHYIIGKNTAPSPLNERRFCFLPTAEPNNTGKICPYNCRNFDTRFAMSEPATQDPNTEPQCAPWRNDQKLNCWLH